MNVHTLRILWPEHILDSHEGWIIGWRMKNLLTISCIFSDDLERSTLEKNLEIINSNHSMVEYWGAKLDVIGYYVSTLDNLKLKKHNNIFLKSVDGLKLLKFSNLETLPQHQFIYFSKPELNYLYIDEIEFEFSKFDIYSSDDNHNTFSSLSNQVNSSYNVELMLTKGMKKKDDINSFWSLSPWGGWKWHLIRVFISLLKLFMPLFKAILFILNISFPFISSLNEISLFASTLTRKCTIYKEIVEEWDRLNSDKYHWRRDLNFQVTYQELCNRLANQFFDILIGVMFIILFWYSAYNNETLISEVSSHLTTLWGYERLKIGIEWMKQGTPGGIKLSKPLANALGSLFLFYIERWATIVRVLSQYSTHMIWITYSSCIFGFTLGISLLHDLMYFFNMHIYWLYSGMTRLYGIQLKYVFSLWLLFRGKKRNVLKNRIDSCDFDLEQLLLGTILFTTLILLLPTTLVYYTYFVSSMLLFIVLQTLFQLSINTVLYFPVYSFILNLLGRLKGGIYLSIVNSDQDGCIRFKLNRKAMMWSVVLNRFFKEMITVLKNFKARKVLKAIIYGERWHRK